MQRSLIRDGETREQQIGRAVGRVGPSMLLTSLSESLAFFLGMSCCSCMLYKCDSNVLTKTKMTCKELGLIKISEPWVFVVMKNFNKGLIRLP